MIVTSYWRKMLIRPHFILWGRVTDDSETIAHLAITERRLRTNSTVWEDIISQKLIHTGQFQALHLIEKFEKLWPCTFLAKEYRQSPYLRREANGLQD